jgi:hypothetical protein
MSSASVTSVMVDGKFILKGGRSPLDNEEVYGRIRGASEKLWARLGSGEF